jgi:hypothetical protein
MTPERTQAEGVADTSSQIAKDAWAKATQAGSMHEAVAIYSHELLQAVYLSEQNHVRERTALQQRNDVLAAALDKIRRLPDRFGFFQGAESANEAIKIAREALGADPA